MVTFDFDETAQKLQRPPRRPSVSSSYLLGSEVVEPSTLRHCPQQEAR
jgi:hypothetical protein